MNGTGSSNMAGPSGRFVQAIEGMREFVLAADCLREVHDRRDEFLYRLESLSLQHKNLEGALVIVLLGGTGVGKSTVINAIAGESVAAVSAIRPCTTAVTYYSHRENDQSLIEEIFQDGDVWRPHSSPGLRRKVLVDPPDFDSMLMSNRRKLLEVMRVADLLLVVVDAEKYRNHSLYKLLHRFRDGRTCLFLLNKSDLGFDRALVEDFRESLAGAGFIRPRIFTASAREAFLARTGQSPGGERGADEFALLEEVIRNEIDKAEIDRIKTSNFTSLLGNTYASIESAVPPGLAAELRALPGWAEGKAQDTASRAAAEITQTVFLENAKLRRLFQSAGNLSIGGLFGLYLTVTEKITALVAPRLGGGIRQDPIQLKAEISKALDRCDRQRIELLIDRFSSECGLKIGSAGGRPDSGEVAALDIDGPAAAREILDRTGRLIQEETDRFMDKSAAGWFKNITYNILPLAGIIYFAYLAVIRVKDGRLLDLSFLITFLIFMVVIFVLQHAMAERGFRRKGARFMKKLEAEMERSVQQLLAGRALPGIRAFSEKMISRIEQFRQIRKLL